MELNHLRYFYEVASDGSFTHAARRLHVSQSALSKAVALLEDSVGVKLLERSKKGVALTDIGTEIFRLSSGIFKTVVEIENTCKGTQEVCEGPLRFGASDHVVNYLLQAEMAMMLTEHPKVLPTVFSGTPHEISALMLTNEVEFGLFFTRLNVPSMNYETVATLPMAVVVHPKHFSGKNSKLPVAEVAKKIGLIGSIRSQYQTNPSEAFVKLVGKQAPVLFESNSQEAQKRFCLNGNGIAFLARFMVEKEIASGELLELPLKKPIELELHLAVRKGVPLSLVARTFIELVRNQLRTAR